MYDMRREVGTCCKAHHRSAQQEQLHGFHRCNHAQATQPKEDNMTRPIRPAGRSINDPLWLRVVKWLATAAAVAVFTVVGAVVLLEWMAGCGETYVNAKGERHANECLFIR
jgi:ferric-dicitrate binding protein FerR (iron transport regulator)